MKFLDEAGEVPASNGGGAPPSSTSGADLSITTGDQPGTVSGDISRVGAAGLGALRSLKKRNKLMTFKQHISNKKIL